MRREVMEEEEYMILGSHHFVVVLVQCPSALEVSSRYFAPFCGLQFNGPCELNMTLALNLTLALILTHIITPTLNLYLFLFIDKRLWKLLKVIIIT